MENIIDEHKQMVLRLKKPGEVIRQTMTATDCDLVHMGGCLMGEASELYEAMTSKESTANDILEELGDFEFYWVACAELLGLNRQNPNLQEEESFDVPESTSKAAVRLMVLGGQFWDVVKRNVVYRKPMEKQKAILILRETEELLAYIEIKYKFTLEQVLQANYTKLADKDKGRYASGTYSDEQAQARRDKVPNSGR